MENGGDMNKVDDLDDETLQALYTWIDEIPLSRPKRNISRDFSDGVLVAEIVHHFFPKLVEIHNYSAANSVTQKKDNWATLQRKVLSRLECRVSDDLIDSICKCRPNAIEVFLITLQTKIDKYTAKKRAASLRKQHQVYDEFSPDPVSDTVLYPQGDDGIHYPYGHDYNSVSYQETSDNPYYAPEIHREHHQASVQGQNQMNSFGDASSDHTSATKTAQSRKKQESVHENKLTNKRPTHITGQQHERSSHGAVVPQNVQLLLEEKEQSLLASQETIQILQVKVRRLEHLLHLKDIRIEDLSRRLQQATQPLPRHLPPQHNAPVPPISGAAGQPLPRMHSTPPLPPVQSPPKHGL